MKKGVIVVVAVIVVIVIVVLATKGKDEDKGSGAGAANVTKGMDDYAPDDKEAAAIDDDMAHPWTLDELASLSGCKITSLTAWFKKAVGFSPMSYVLHCRLARAKDMLLETSYSITVIAHALNFTSSQQFATIFRRKLGLTPSQYRKREKAKGH